MLNQASFLTNITVLENILMFKVILFQYLLIQFKKNHPIFSRTTVLFILINFYLKIVILLYLNKFFFMFYLHIEVKFLLL